MTVLLHRYPRRWAVLSCLLLAAGLGARSAPARAQGPELVDRIVAVVDDEAILSSDLEREVESYKFDQAQQSDSTKENDATIRKEMLDRLIDVKLLVAQAKLDGVEVKDDEVDQAVARSLDEIISRFGTKAELLKELARNGMTFDDLQARNRDLIRNRLYTSRMISTHIRPLIEVREDEVRSFYQDHLDQVPRSPETITVSNVLVVPQPEEKTQKSLKTKLDAIHAAFDANQSFEDVAKKYSEGPNAGRGGLLGSFAKGDLFHPVLEEMAWTLPVGQVSDPVTTELGVHILKVVERTDTKVTLRQILLRVPITDADWDRAKARAEEVYEKALGGQDFATLVENYSDDPTSREKGGVLGTFPLEKLTPAFRNALQGLQPGGVGKPIKGTAGYFVLHLDAKNPAHVMTYDEVKDQLHDAVEDQKIQVELKKFLKGLREKFYIDIKM
jgi:peptidyl-prolyl cis-trans isomerase SurA